MEKGPSSFQSKTWMMMGVLPLAFVACLGQGWLVLGAHHAWPAAAATAAAAAAALLVLRVSWLWPAVSNVVPDTKVDKEHTVEQMTCAIGSCDDPPPEEFQMPTVDCRHEKDVCMTCLGHHVSANLDKSNTDNIRCCGGGNNCDKVVSADDLIRIFGVKHELVLRYNDVLLKNMLSVDGEFLRCAWEDCESFGQEVVGGAEAASFFTCSTCQRKTCVHHQSKWHDGMTCKEYDQQKEKEAAAAEAVAAAKAVKAEGRAAALAAGVDLKECPKCAMPFTREEGCPVMRCCGRGGDDACKMWTKEHPHAPCNHNPLGGEQKFCGHRFCVHCLGDIFEDDRGDHDYCCPMHPINSGVE